MHTWESGTTYSPGDAVLHEGKLYIKDDDSDQSEPDSTPGGWTESSSSQNNLQEYLVIEQSLTSYEARRDAYQAQVAVDKASAEAKLQALGLTADELKALGL